MNTTRRRREGGACGFRDLHDRHAMHTRGIRIGNTFLRVAGIEVCRGRRLYLMSTCLVCGYLGSLNGEILGSLIDLFYDIGLVVSLDSVMRVTPLVFLCRRGRA